MKAKTWIIIGASLALGIYLYKRKKSTDEAAGEEASTGGGGGGVGGGGGGMPVPEVSEVPSGLGALIPVGSPLLGGGGGQNININTGEGNINTGTGGSTPSTSSGVSNILSGGGSMIPSGGSTSSSASTISTPSASALDASKAPTVYTAPTQTISNKINPNTGLNVVYGTGGKNDALKAPTVYTAPTGTVTNKINPNTGLNVVYGAEAKKIQTAVSASLSSPGTIPTSVGSGLVPNITTAPKALSVPIPVAATAPVITAPKVAPVATITPKSNNPLNQPKLNVPKTNIPTPQVIKAPPAKLSKPPVAAFDGSWGNFYGQDYNAYGGLGFITKGF